MKSASMTLEKQYVWLDCDPGHDDATAILLALHCEIICLLGVSTVHGNADAKCTADNAARCLYAFGAREGQLHVFPGASKPLIRPAKHDLEIHGPDGLGGVQGLPKSGSSEVSKYFGEKTAIEAIADAVRTAMSENKKVTIITCGPLTNIALFVVAYPVLLQGIAKIVFMGGGVGMGNRSAVAEFNILCDPEAAQIVLDAPVMTVMIPINVTHTVIVNNNVHAELLSAVKTGSAAVESLSPKTPLRFTLSTLIGFFADSYKSTFGFNNGPPLHDAVAVAYVACPELFDCVRYRVDVETKGDHTCGETVVDVWKYKQCDETWGSSGLNCLVATKVDVDGFFQLFLECVSKCDQSSPLNRKLD